MGQCSIYLPKDFLNPSNKNLSTSVRSIDFAIAKSNASVDLKIITFYINFCASLQ